MRLLFVIHDRERYTAGPVINMLRLLPELVKRGYEVFALIAYKGSRSSCAQDLKEAGVNCILRPFPKFTEDYIIEIISVYHNIKPDVFVPNVSFQGAYAGKWIKKAGTPVIVSQRSEDRHNWSMVEMFITGKEAWAASALVCVSSFLKSEVKARFKGHIPIEVIASGAPFSLYAAAHNTGRLKVIYAGRLEQKAKRIHDLVKAFMSAINMGVDVELTLIGEGSEKEKLIKAVDVAGLSQRITFKPMKTGEAYHKELSQHHVIVLLSDYEGMPGSIIDGMMCGLVPVCLRTNGIEDLVRHNETGLLLNNRDTDLLHALKTLIEDVSLRRELSANAIHHVNQNFSVHSMADKWESLIQAFPKSEKKGRITLPSNLNLPVSTIPFEGASRRCLPLSYRVRQKLIAYKRRFNEYTMGTRLM